MLPHNDIINYLFKLKGRNKPEQIPIKKLVERTIFIDYFTIDSEPISSVSVVQETSCI